MFKVDIPPETPAWRQEFSACENCERLEERIKVLESDLEETRGDAADFEAQLERERTSVNELSLHCQVLAEALKRIYELGENTGSHVSWKAVYEQAQTIAQKALDGK